jgi:hypothetical protein
MESPIPNPLLFRRRIPVPSRLEMALAMILLRPLVRLPLLLLLLCLVLLQVSELFMASCEWNRYV